MIKPTDFFKWIKKVLDLAEDVKKAHSEIKEVRQEVKTLAEVVRDLKYEIQAVKEHDQHEREKLVLQLENALLRHQVTQDARRSPATPPKAFLETNIDTEIDEVDP